MTAAPNYRAQARDATAAVLTAALATLGVTVYRARRLPFPPTDYPSDLRAVQVYGWHEDKRQIAVTSPDQRFTTTCKMAVTCTAAHEDPESLEATLETLAAAAQDAVLRAPELIGNDGLLESIEAVRTEIEIAPIKESGQAFVGSASLTFDMRWSEVFLQHQPGDDADDSGFIGCATLDVEVQLPFGGP